MKKWIYIGIASILTILFIIFQGYTIKKYKNLYKKVSSNVEAYQSANSGLEDDILQYQMTIEQLRHSKDSIDSKLVSTINELGISYKKIKSLQYKVSEAVKTDTINFIDTIFVPRVYLDTIIDSTWYNLNLSLRYPSTIIVTPSFISEETVIIHESKEYNKTPSKCLLIRLFQKKHTVTKVTVEEKNPYIKIKTSKFIKND